MTNIWPPFCSVEKKRHSGRQFADVTPTDSATNEPSATKSSRSSCQSPDSLSRKELNKQARRTASPSLADKAKADTPITRRSRSAGSGRTPCNGGNNTTVVDRSSSSDEAVTDAECHGETAVAEYNTDQMAVDRLDSNPVSSAVESVSPACVS